MSAWVSISGSLFKPPTVPATNHGKNLLLYLWMVPSLRRSRQGNCVHCVVGHSFGRRLKWGFMVYTLYLNTFSVQPWDSALTIICCFCRPWWWRLKQQETSGCLSFINSSTPESHCSKSHLLRTIITLSWKSQYSSYFLDPAYISLDCLNFLHACL